LFLLIAPTTVSSRFYSIFDPSNPTNRDRVAMLHYGSRMVADHPWTGVGPDMVKEVYSQYRDQPPSGPVLALDVERWVGWSAMIVHQ